MNRTGTNAREVMKSLLAIRFVRRRSSTRSDTSMTADNESKLSSPTSPFSSSWAATSGTLRRLAKRKKKPTSLFALDQQGRPVLSEPLSSDDDEPYFQVQSKEEKRHRYPRSYHLRGPFEKLAEDEMLPKINSRTLSRKEIQASPRSLHLVNELFLQHGNESQSTDTTTTTAASELSDNASLGVGHHRGASSLLLSKKTLSKIDEQSAPTKQSDRSSASEEDSNDKQDDADGYRFSLCSYDTMPTTRGSFQSTCGVDARLGDIEEPTSPSSFYSAQTHAFSENEDQHQQHHQHPAITDDNNSINKDSEPHTTTGWSSASAPLPPSPPSPCYPSQHDGRLSHFTTTEDAPLYQHTRRHNNGNAGQRGPSSSTLTRSYMALPLSSSLATSGQQPAVAAGSSGAQTQSKYTLCGKSVFTYSQFDRVTVPHFFIKFAEDANVVRVYENGEVVMVFDTSNKSQLSSARLIASTVDKLLSELTSTSAAMQGT